MGTPDFAVTSLKALSDAKHSILAVITQPDKPKGRGRVMTMPPVKALAIKQGIPVYQPEKIRDKGIIQKIKTLSPDLIVVVAYGKIIPETILNIPPKGCINVHASLLPKYRGAAPINCAIIRGEQETGVTIMFIDKGMDTGPVLSAEKVPIYCSDTAIDLHDKLKIKGAQLLVKTIELLQMDNIVPEPQDDSMATYAPMLKKEDGRVDWGKDAEEIRNLVRGLFPWPCAYTHCNDTTLKIFNGKIAPKLTNAIPGTVIGTDTDGLRIATGNGIFIIQEVQPANGKRLKISEFLRGHKIATGQILN